MSTFTTNYFGEKGISQLLASLEGGMTHQVALLTTRNSLPSTLTGSDDVHIHDKFLGDDSIKLLVAKLRAAKPSSGKRSLTLRGNCITSNGAAAIAELLEDDNSIRSLSLEWNQIGSIGAISIAKVLATNKTLTSIDLRNNGITDEGAQAIAAMLLNNFTLTMVDLRWNAITDSGAVAFENCLLDRTPQVSLQLSGNSISNFTTETLENWSQGIRMEEATAAKLTEYFDGESGAGVAAGRAPLPSEVLPLQKEIVALRQKVQVVQNSCDDLQRQLDGSTVRVVDLESEVGKAQFKHLQLSEQLKNANSRISQMTGASKSMLENFEKERHDIMNDLSERIAAAEQHARVCVMERDSAQEKLGKVDGNAERLLKQMQSVVDQSKQDRDSMVEELRVALNKTSESSIRESKHVADISSLRTVNQRLEERVRLLESELDTCRSESEKVLLDEITKRDSEIDKLRSEIVGNTTAVSERTYEQTKEITSLKSKVQDLESLMTKQRIDLQLQRDRAVIEAHEAERLKYEAMNKGNQDKLDLYLRSRDDLEKRSNDYSEEIRLMQKDHAAAITQMRHQLGVSEDEIKRLRANTLAAKEGYGKSEVDNRGMRRELEELKKKMISALEESETSYKMLQEAVEERQALRTSVDELQRRVATFNESRSAEFSHVQKAVQGAVEQELEKLKIAMKIK